MNMQTDPYQIWQLERYGNVLPEDTAGSFAPNLTEREKAIAWSEFEYQQQLWNDERNFPYNEHSQF
jgi:hypothetical protein